jgi:3-hydroxyisobutyrate dehydrogenase-like beta-hydroxyacid dehydrogenase
MGQAMAVRLHQAGADIAGFNRTRAKAAALEAAGVALVERPAELAARDIVFTSVSTAADLDAVLTGPGGLLADPARAPRILVDLSTIAPQASAKLRALAAKRGTAMLVVAVSGNDVVARAGKLGMMVSGPRAAFDAVAPLLPVFGPKVSYVGEGDAARIVKICHNLFLGITFEGLAETALLAQANGVPRAAFMEVINNSVLGSTFSRYKTPVIANLDHTVTFTSTLMMKDLELGLAAARDKGVALPATALVRELVAALIGDGRAEQDYTLILDKLAQRSGMTLASENAKVGDGL